MLQSGIPVLMYHALLEKDPGPQVNSVHVLVKDFTDQMAWLADNDYKAVSINELLYYLRKPDSKEKLVVLTFDDGYLSLLNLATPILLNYGFKATLFLTTYPVGEKSYSALKSFGTSYPPDDRPLDWKELKQMEGMCWNIEAHGEKHLAHNMLSDQDLFHEMNDCKTKIAINLGKEVLYYAYPQGRYNVKCLQMLSELNLMSGFSVHPGLAERNSDIRRLPRIEINREDTMASFTNKVQTGYVNRNNQIKSRLRYLIYKNPYLKDLLKLLKDKIRPTTHVPYD